MDSRANQPDRQAVVVSFAEFAGDLPISPRIQRTTHLTRTLEGEFGFRVTRVPDDLGQGARTGGGALRGLVRKALGPLLLDHLEIPARLTMRDWRPSGSGALLIGWPYSPIYVAASHLVAAGVPYVVDIGDPWVLTDPTRPPWSRRVSTRRSQAAETFLWRHAAAGVVTTETQARGLRALFPDLELLVRPNGYLTADGDAGRGLPADGAGDDELRLVHFGSINSARVPIGEWLSSLRDAAGTRVRFANYGPVDRPELLEAEDPAVVVETHEPVDWARACQIARTFHAAVVITNADPAKLPSKAIQYLTLPVPRIALTAAGDGGELAAFAAERPGFIGVGLDAPQDIPRMLSRLRRAWSDEELSPSRGDSWAEVAGEIARFAIGSWEGAGALRTRRGEAEPVAAA